MVSGETLLSRNIRQAGVEARYDAACKKLLSHKIILAWIMKSCLDEYKHLDVLQIAANYIEGVPQIAEIGVILMKPIIRITRQTQIYTAQTRKVSPRQKAR